MDINSDLVTAAHDLRRLRIVQIDQEIAQLQTERHALVESLAFPVITLPVEITSLIFIHSLPDNPLDPTASDAAVVLGSVCRQWREIALSIPQLWSSWSLAIDGQWDYLDLIRDSFELWVSRSKNQPLSIRLHHINGTGQDASAQDQEWWDLAYNCGIDLVEMVGEHHRRWKNIEFSIPVTFLQRLSPLDGLPHLTHLVLGSNQEDWGGSDNSEEPFTLFGAAPQLRSLHMILDTQNHLSRFDKVLLPYAQLTNFTGTRFSALECLFVLSRMPALVECLFYIGGSAPMLANNDFSSPITLPHLTSLKLWSMGSRSQPSIVLQHLTLPSLEMLAVGRDDDIHTPYTFAPLLALSEYPLQHFSCESLEPEDVSKYLEVMPDLLTLELLNYDQQKAMGVIQHLHSKLEADDLPLIPPLENITIHCQRKPHDGDFSFHALLLLLDRFPSSLRRFRLVWTTSLLPRRPNAREVKSFKHLIKGGMAIYVGCQDGPSWV